MLERLTSERVTFNLDIPSVKDVKKEFIIPGYDEVYDKIKLILDIENTGYNLFLIDEYSEDKLDNIIKYIEKILSKKSPPKDICYIIDGDEKSPKPVYLSNGNGIVFQEIVEEIKDVYYDIVFKFYNGSNTSEKDSIIEKIHKERNDLVAKLLEAAKENGFELKPYSGGFSFIPLKEGNAMTETEYELLESEKKDVILSKIGFLKETARKVFERLKEIENEEMEKIKEIFMKYLLQETREIKSKYNIVFTNDPDIVNILDKLCETLEESFINIYSMNYEDDEDKINDIINRYNVNVIVDNSNNCNPKVIYEEDPSINNLIGYIEYENKNGVYSTDVTLINSGSILQANEGCLIIRATDLFNYPSSYYYLKRCLLTNKINFEYNKNYIELLSLSSLKPDPIDINLKIILIGDYYTYDILYNLDEDFKRIFKLRGEYNSIISIDQKNISKIVAYIDLIRKRNDLCYFDNKAIDEILKYLSRKAENREKIHMDYNELNKILLLTNQTALYKGKKLIEDIDVRETIYVEEDIEKDFLENYKKSKILLDVKGEKIGQINALSVIDTGYIRFGKPIKITCSCYKGDGNIIDVQKESNLSGKIHSKSVNILKGCIKKIIGGYMNLPVDFHLSFEQLYGMLDGDSASVAEIVCMLSAVSKLPVKQNIAVTGSINQMGEVQPIGGVNEKIEGFFKINKLIDSTDNKGILIPESNVENLVLNHEVENEIKKGKFNIYTMSNLEDAINLLIGNDNLKYSQILDIIERELKKYATKKK